MDDPNLDIAITADSSGAVQAFDGLGASVQGFDKNVGDLSTTFARPLENVGVHIFGRELLRSMGIAGEARPIISLLHVAVTELGMAFNFATGPIGLAVMGLTAAAAIAYKVVESHKAHEESLKKLIEESKRSYDSTVDQTKSLDEYKKVVGDLPPVLQTLEAAIRSKMAATKEDTIVNEEAQIKVLTETIATREKTNASMEESIRVLKTMAGGQYGMGLETLAASKSVDELNQKIKENQNQNISDAASIKSLTADVDAQKKGFKDWADEVKKATEEKKKANEDQKKSDQDELTNWFRVQREKERQMRESERYTKEIISSRYNIEIAMLHGVGMVHAVMADTVQKAWGEAYLSMAKGAGDSFADMIVDGESFREGMDKVFKDILKQFISMIVQMEVRYAAATFLTAMGLPIVPATAMPAPRLAAASGTDRIFSTPTMIMVGEGGEPERVTVTPNSQAQIQAVGGGQSRGGDNINVNIVVQGNNDPEGFGRRLMAYISQQTRGRGQIRPVGGSIY